MVGRIIETPRLGWIPEVSESMDEAMMAPRTGCSLPADKAKQTKRHPSTLAKDRK